MIRFFFMTFMIFGSLYSHEGHEVTSTTGQRSLAELFGMLHLVFLHFPIALIVMTALAEFLFAWDKRPFFNDAAKFMLISAAALSVPTVIFGLIFRFSATYTGYIEELMDLHMGFGIATCFLAIGTAFLRERFGANALYYSALFILFWIVNATAFIGGEVSFGPVIL